MHWITVEVFDGATSAAGWARVWHDRLIEAAVTSRAVFWDEHEHRWGVVLEFTFDDDRRRDAFREVPVLLAALDAAPDPVNGVLVYPHRGAVPAAGSHGVRGPCWGAAPPSSRYRRSTRPCCPARRGPSADRRPDPVRRTTVGGMVLVVLELVVILALVAALVWALRNAQRPATTAALPSRQRAELAAAIERARWLPAHDELDGATRVMVRRTYIGLDGRPEVLDERVLETFPAQDPAWEARFTEAMAAARYRCTYLNAEEAG
ncbi:hypothetical protein [Blastococcus brunescens]|uniref:DUF4129 domain-containing protein n=1 Tax=Blastococcus brunescens TaxID=1564165 RepID=A0ABZ1B1H4_9ACTN|nr:hypothetical protein [Blastococcus sp. BMG 8361]WRL64662.1 hypothetical protein U6N30_02425 [Blastococcus sp. BMG 8361]